MTTQLKWKYYLFEVRSPGDSAGSKPREVAVYCPFEEAAVHGVGIFEGETVTRKDLSKADEWFRGFQCRMSPDDGEVAMFFKGMSRCYRYKITGRLAIQSCLRRARSPYFRGVLASLWLRMGGTVDGSASLVEAMELFPGVFDKSMLAVLHAGSESAHIDEVLESLARGSGRGQQFLRKVKSAFVYPAAVCAIALVGVVVLGFTMVPRMAEIYKEMNLELPLPTQILMKFFTVLTNHWYLLGIPIFIVFWSLRNWKSVKHSRLVEKIMVRMPVFGVIFRGSSLVRSIRAYALVKGAGVDIAKSFSIAGEVANHHEYRAYFQGIGAKHLAGLSLPEAFLQEAGRIPKDGLDLAGQVDLGDMVQDVSGVLTDYAEDLDEKLQILVSTLPSLLEPFLMLFLGLGVGGLIMAIYYPYFNMMTALVSQIG